MSELKFFAVFEYGALDVVSTFDTVARVLETQDREVSKLRATLKKKPEDTLPVELSGCELDIADVKHHQLSWVSVKGASLTVERCNQLCAELSNVPGLTMAFVIDRDYDYWQNAEDILQYKTAGRKFDHLPKKSNGLPFPLEQTVIDVSKNPGRRVLRQGYIEVPASIMWLACRFWSLTGTKPVGGDDGFTVSQPKPGLIRIQAGDRPFSTDTGQQAELQDRMRKLLFP